LTAIDKSLTTRTLLCKTKLLKGILFTAAGVSVDIHKITSCRNSHNYQVFTENKTRSTTSMEFTWECVVENTRSITPINNTKLINPYFVKTTATNLRN